MRREEKIGVFAGIVLVFAIVIVISSMVWAGNFNNKNTIPTAPSTPLIPAGTVISVNTSSYQYYSFQTTNPETFSGSFSSNIPVSFYILTQSQFASVQVYNSVAPLNYVKYVPGTTGYDFSWTIQSGTYVLLFMNQNGNSVAHISVVNGFQLSNYYV